MCHVWIRPRRLTDRLNGGANFDGEVQFSDFLILSDNFGQVDGSWSAGDFDSDGLVGFRDFVILSNNFGKSAPIAASVPEPSGNGPHRDCIVRNTAPSSGT